MLEGWLETIFIYPRRSAAIAALVIVLGGGLLWWQFIWQSPQHVFQDMLINNLETPSVTKQASATNQGQTISQVVQQQMGGTNVADWVVDVRQGDSAVDTESLGTPQTGFIRYTNIATAQRKANSQSYDFSGLLNVWGKSDGKTDTSLNQLFGQTLLDVSSAPLPPIGNLPDNERMDILNDIRNGKIFSPNYGSVKREVVDGHAVYTYAMSVPLPAYLSMMQRFARDLGLKSLDTVDPSQYISIAPIPITLSVDRASHQLVRAAYEKSGFTQTYGGWGIIAPIQIPHTTVTTTDLQGRIQAISSQK